MARFFARSAVTKGAVVLDYERIPDYIYDDDDELEDEEEYPRVDA